MKSEIEKIFKMFEGEAKTKKLKNQYSPKLNLVFLPYLNNKYHCESMTIKEVENVLKLNVNEHDLIQSGVLRLRSQKVKKIQAAEDYVQAFNAFFKFLDEKIKISNMTVVMMKLDTNTKQYAEKILEEFNRVSNGKNLEQKATNGCLKDSQYQKIMNACRNKVKEYIHKEVVDFSQYLSFEIAIVLELLLVYGFSAEVVWGLQRKQYDEQMGTLSLSVVNELHKKEEYILELPRLLDMDIKKLMIEQERVKARKGKRKWNEKKLLFVNSEGMQMDNTYLTNFFKQIEETDDKDSQKNNITPTGVMKYGIKCMIEQHIDREIIEVITGHDDTIYLDCLNEINRTRKHNSKYLNSIIKSSKTYSKLNPPTN